MLTKLKQTIQQMLTFEAKQAHRMRLSPNRISALGAIFASVAAFFYFIWHGGVVYLLFGTIFLLLSGFCDALDGVVARTYGQSTPFGGFFDSVLDRYAETTILGSIVITGLCDVSWGVIAIAGSLLVSYSRARAEGAGVKMESIGLAERPERIVILAAGSTIAVFWEARTVINATVAVLAILSNFTVLQRAAHAYNELKKKNVK